MFKLLARIADALERIADHFDYKRESIRAQNLESRKMGEAWDGLLKAIATMGEDDE